MEEDYKNIPDCQNCPYFINKLVCPFHQKKGLKDANLIIQGQVKGRTSEGCDPS